MSKVKLVCEWLIPRAEAEREIREHGPLLPKRARGKTIAALAREEFRTCRWVCKGRFRGAQFSERKSPGHTAIIHPSTKPRHKGRWQVSYFDEKGAWGDAIRDTCTEALGLLSPSLWRLRKVE